MINTDIFEIEKRFIVCEPKIGDLWEYIEPDGETWVGFITGFDDRFTAREYIFHGFSGMNEHKFKLGFSAVRCKYNLLCRPHPYSI